MSLNRFSCEGQEFRFWCDANEYSWQLCRGYVSSLPDEEHYRIRKYDDNSFAVVDIESKEFVMVANVIKL